jgi:hypothetical protein
MTTESAHRLGALVLSGCLFLCANHAAAQPAAPAATAAATNPTLDRIKSLNNDAKTAFGAYSFKKARRKLDRGIRLATQAEMLGDPALAETYVLLGVAHISGSNDLYRGLHYFVRAYRLNRKIRVPKNLATPQLAQMFKYARQTVKAVGKPPTIRLGKKKRRVDGPKKGDPVKKSGRGLIHSPVDFAKRGLPIAVKASTGGDIQAHRVYLFYRPAGTVKFFKIPMKKTRGVFRGAIPARATSGRYIHYYIKAVDQRGRLAGSKGSAGSPNQVFIK